MDEDRNNALRDESLLIDLLLGRCGEADAAGLKRRLAAEPHLRQLHEDLRNTLAAVALVGEVEPPEDLVASTLGRLRAARQTEALLAREELGRRDVIRPTFSLRELAAVAAVVLIFAGLFGTFVRQGQRRRTIDECKAHLGQIGSALLTYAGSNDGRLPAVGPDAHRWLPAANQPAVSNSVALFRLVRQGYASPVIFQCPAVGEGSFVVRQEMADFPGVKFISYSYQHALGTPGLWIEDPRMAAHRSEMVVLADANPVFRDGRFERERVRSPVSDNHDRTGMNVLFLPGNVEFKDNASVGVLGDNIYTIEGVVDYRGDEAPASPIDTFLAPAFSGPGAPGGGR